MGERTEPVNPQFVDEIDRSRRFGTAW